jgi:aminoglycoside phosphotransferase (APT) family kinase protein
VLSESTRRWIEDATGGRVISVKAMRGATSSLLHTIELEVSDRRRILVLRRFNDARWVKREPDVAKREATSLQHAVRAGLAAPTVIAVDADGDHCGVPATLVTLIEGAVILDPPDLSQWVGGLAKAAALIHRVDAAGFRWKYHRYNDGVDLAVPVWSHEPDAWQKAIDVVTGPQPAYAECFVHRDYHPSNVLWDNGRVTGVVDWVNGCRGPANIDVAWCRHNLANLHGVTIADAFLASYMAAAGPEFHYDPYWDLMSVVELLPGPPAMYAGWRASGVAAISNVVMRERVDTYVASVVARL